MRGLAFLLMTSSLITGCAITPPEGITPVANFEPDRYLGTWYEIARLENTFERGLTDVTATYEKIDEETISVTNRGYDTVKGKWRSIEGKAKILGDPTVGALKVSFFGPFYAGYFVYELDHEEYQYALVSSGSKRMMWLLAREPQLAPATYQALLQIAEQNGFNTAALVEVTHENGA